MKERVVLRSVLMRLGVLSVTTSGVQMMQMWLVGNLASPRLVIQCFLYTHKLCVLYSIVHFIQYRCYSSV